MMIIIVIIIIIIIMPVVVVIHFGDVVVVDERRGHMRQVPAEHERGENDKRNDEQPHDQRPAHAEARALAVGEQVHLMRGSTRHETCAARRRASSTHVTTAPPCGGERIDAEAPRLRKHTRDDSPRELPSDGHDEDGPTVRVGPIDQQRETPRETSEG